MKETKFTIDTITKAINILSSYGEPITEPKSLKNVRIGNVSYTNGQTGEPFTWENSGEAYAIVNLRCTAPDLFANALEILQDDMFADVQTDETIEEEDLLDALREACNCNLSFNASLDKARELESVGRANIDIEEVSLQEEGEFGLRVAGCRPVMLENIKKASTNSLLTLLNRVEKEEVVENDNDTE